MLLVAGSGSARFAELLQKRTAAFMGGAAAVIYGGSQPTEFAGGEWWGATTTRATARLQELLPQASFRVCI